MEMTSRQRVEAALSHRAPDRTPVFEYVLLSPLADRLLGRTYGGDPVHWGDLVAELGWEGAVRRRALDQLELAVRLGHDLMYVVPVPPPPTTRGLAAAASGPPPALPPEDPVAAMARRNEAAAAAPPPDDRPLSVYRVLQEEMAHRDLDLPVLAPAYGHGVWTDVDLMQTLLLAPEVAATHFGLATARCLAMIERYLDLGIRLIGIGGDFAGTRPIIAPAAYRQFIVPQVRACASRIHARGGWAINASDGDLWSVIDDFLIGCQVDAYLEIDWYAGMDLGRLKAAYGERITFFGNLDCGTVLSFATPAEVRQHTLDCLRAGGGSGHILCASNAITASVPLTNYLAVVNAYRDTFNLDRFDP
jgi:hypothetical protein